MMARVKKSICMLYTILNNSVVELTVLWQAACQSRCILGKEIYEGMKKSKLEAEF